MQDLIYVQINPFRIVLFSIMVWQELWCEWYKTWVKSEAYGEVLNGSVWFETQVNVAQEPTFCKDLFSILKLDLKSDFYLLRKLTYLYHWNGTVSSIPISFLTQTDISNNSFSMNFAYYVIVRDHCQVSLLLLRKFEQMSLRFTARQMS